MIKEVTNKLLGYLGFQIIRVPKQHARHRSALEAPSHTDKDGFVEKIAEDPLNANLHLQHAIDTTKKGMPYLAYAELKTAEYLGASREDVEKYATAFRNALPDPEHINHNQYFRFASLASEILSRGGKSDLSILDVGGGQGELASFLPDVSYCLVEPTVNGISGTNLPFPDHSFDYVVSCHVLEHIPVNERKDFLDQLLAKAKHGVILLNPFHVDRTHVDERLKLFIEITGAQWAKEHLDCALPRIDEIKDYATDRGLQFCVKPNGTMTTSMAFVFLDHFAARSGLHEDWEKINTFFNQKYTKILDSEKYPTAFIVYLGWPESGDNAAEQIAHPAAV